MWSPRALAPLSFIGLVIYPFWVPLYPIEFSISQREIIQWTMVWNQNRMDECDFIWQQEKIWWTLILLFLESYTAIKGRQIAGHVGFTHRRILARRGNEYSISLLELYENFLRMLFVLYSFWVSWILAHNVFDLLTSSTFQLWGWQVIQKSVTKSLWSNI